jgi:repressor LexA
MQVITESVRRRGYPPTMREIGEAVGLASSSSVSAQIDVLEAKGYLRRAAGRPRSVEVRLPGKPAVRPGAETAQDTAADILLREGACVPVLGRIAAGLPALAEQSIEDIFLLPRQLVGEGDDLFLLQVTGESMTGVGIMADDWVVVRRQPDADDGSVVAALIDGETTVRAIQRSAGKIWLMPSNPAYAPVPGDEATILGPIVTLLRRF